MGSKQSISLISKMMYSQLTILIGTINSIVCIGMDCEKCPCYCGEECDLDKMRDIVKKINDRM